MAEGIFKELKEIEENRVKYFFYIIFFLKKIISFVLNVAMDQQLGLVLI